MEKMQKSSELSWIEVQFLKEAVETVVQCRNTLKWSKFYINLIHLISKIKVIIINNNDKIK